MEPHGKKTITFFVASAGLLSGAGAVSLAGYAQKPGILADGVHVIGVDWSGKPVADLRAALDDWRAVRRKETVSLVLPAEKGRRRTWAPTRGDLGADVDVDATAAEAERVGRNDGAYARLVSWFSGHKAVEVPPVWKVDDRRVRAYLQKRVAPRVVREMQDARLISSADHFEVVPEKSGRALDLDAASTAVAARLTSLTQDPVSLPVKTVPAHVTSADLGSVQGEVSRFTTHYSESGNRRRNIELAAAHINGVVLKPGDVFSYNRVVGPRDEDAGFKMAPVIIRGKLEPGLGGGICQVSSTLYNAVLRADLKFVRRSHHAFPVHYLPAGQDATVAYDSVDFQFQNNTPETIAISASGTDGRVVMRILGKPVPGREVKIERTNVSTLDRGEETIHDSSLPAGTRRTVESGHSGHRVTVWRTVFVNGQKVKREMISRDYYRPFPRVVTVGTRPVAPRPQPTGPGGGPVGTPATIPTGGAAGSAVTTPGRS